MVITRIVLLACVAFGALVVSDRGFAALPRHHTPHQVYDGNLNIPYGVDRVIKSDGSYAIAGRIVRCPWRRGCF